MKLAFGAVTYLGMLTLAIACVSNGTRRGTSAQGTVGTDAVPLAHTMAPPGPVMALTAVALPCPGVLPLSVPSGWSLVSEAVGTWLLGGGEGETLYRWNGTGYDVIVPQHGAFPNNAPGQLGEGIWVYLNAAQNLCIGGHDLTPVQVPAGQWALVGDDSSFTVQVTGADAVWTYAQATGYVLVHTLSPGQGAWVYSAGGGTVTLLPTSGPAFDPGVRISPPGGTPIVIQTTPAPHVPSPVSTLPPERMLPPAPFDPARPTGKAPAVGQVQWPIPCRLIQPPFSPLASPTPTVPCVP